MKTFTRFGHGLSPPAKRLRRMRAAIPDEFSDETLQRAHVERLSDHDRRAAFEGLGRQGDVVGSREHDHRDRRIDVLDLFQEMDAADTRKDDVEQYEIGTLLTDAGQ